MDLVLQVISVTNNALLKSEDTVVSSRLNVVKGLKLTN
jgi:hypothetical protein